MVREAFFQGKRVLVTGHTGFKGSWLCKILGDMGAEIIGYALKPTHPSLYELAGLDRLVCSVIGDIRDFAHLKQIFERERPEIVLHLAAQPIVRESYINPRDTYDINVMGTVNVLECVRQSDTVVSMVNVTTDKVYKNREWEWGYREVDRLDGFDPYSNSKSCSELATHSYKQAFFENKKTAISTVRAGNVIGGGDFAKDRIMPDCVRAAQRKDNIIIRNPYSVRPYQHVLDPLYAYLMVAQSQAIYPEYAGCYNVGPEEKDCITTGDLAQLFCEKWGQGISWETTHSVIEPHEANFLKLDCAKIKHVFGWEPVWGVEKAVEKTVEWAESYLQKESVLECMDRQLQEFRSEPSFQKMWQP